ncbi:Ldh family oxidoreductase [Noviherbaspirillum galbum]|uniref:Ldh family oxidoreductase n=1 Tax=Noviherbaspirillum galbum TaxID=2709383 RepID=A0A6B3SW06_9BURK|nr:Ldh family oxidoreductase [Noviherbaspirillum galbum]NEX64728.1 Ldh family oxidoreductase [Noviherbaspirillum galbum]
MNSGQRYSAPALSGFANRLLRAAGMAAPQADAVADVLVEGDLMGHDTHGLALLPRYLDEVERGGMARGGEPVVLSDRGGALNWDGMRLPGPWLVLRGIDALVPRAREAGCATLTIRRSHHIACLAAYLLRATEAGFLVLLASSDPAVASVAPHGGTRAVFTPNPLAAGIPTSSTPFLIDISTSIKTNGMSARLHQAGALFEEECMLDANGMPTRDPGVLFADPPGTIMPLGGLGSGHKGFGLSLIIEALTGGLAGMGRADPHEGWGATVFLALFDPDAFGGRDAFTRQMDWIAAACRANPPRPGVDAVRMPGDRGLLLRQEQLRDGVSLGAGIAEALHRSAERYGERLPEPVT